MHELHEQILGLDVVLPRLIGIGESAGDAPENDGQFGPVVADQRVALHQPFGELPGLLKCGRASTACPSGSTSSSTMRMVSAASPWKSITRGCSS